MKSKVSTPPRVDQKGKTKVQPKQRKSLKIKDLNNPSDIKKVSDKVKHALLQQILVQSQMSGVSVKDITELSNAYRQLHSTIIEELKVNLAKDSEQLPEDENLLDNDELLKLVESVKKELK